MAVSLNDLGEIANVTLSATANNVTEVTLPQFCNQMTVRFVGAAGKIADVGTDGQPIGGVFLTVSADTSAEIDLFNRPGNTARQVRYFASGTANTVVQILPVRSSL
jgi:hypothetical protein